MLCVLSTLHCLQAWRCDGQRDHAHSDRHFNFCCACMLRVLESYGKIHIIDRMEVIHTIESYILTCTESKHSLGMEIMHMETYTVETELKHNGGNESHAY